MRKHKPRRSLRTILMIWFLLLSLVPLMFVTGYSLVKYEQAIDNELVQRLRANSREFITTIDDAEKYLATRRTRHRSDSVLATYLLTNSATQARDHMQSFVRGSLLSSSSIFDREGHLLATIIPGDKTRSSQEDSGIVLSDALKEKLENSTHLTLVDSGAKNSMDLIAITRIEGKNGRRAGYVEEIINIGEPFLDGLKKRLNLEIILFDKEGAIIAGSHPDFLLYPKTSFAKTVAGEGEAFFDLTVRNEPFGFITNTVKWGDTQFLVALGASKQKSRAVLKTINYAFFTMIGAIGILLVFTSIVATRVIVRPVYELVEAIHAMDSGSGPVEITSSSDTELGVLTESFNEMSRRIHQAKGDLEKKIKELEGAYAELKETQSRLVHSAKMASLGQMVAGIAHELNNPIGFIFSNMTILRDYSQRLNRIIETAEKDPKALAKSKNENDFEFIKEDLPKLISSCEEGARRTRDIVLGLRNFSRLEEAKIKRVSIQEGIENTLMLLSGETKNRVRIHKDFQDVPEILCYPSQLNQVFMNILTNAAQAIDGEGDIWIELKKIEAKGRPAMAQISIRDSGRGIPSDVAEKIFDPFFTTKSVGQGTGLGLSISYGIVKKHGGDIQVKSVPGKGPGKGTEFIITVPIDGPTDDSIATA